MRTYLFILLYCSIALIGSGFLQSKEKKEIIFYWYKYDHVQCRFIYDCRGVTPTVMCFGFFDPCAKGFFTIPQNPNTATPDVELFSGSL